jgi:phosphatidylserine/phosphatidylglycerophosphate/cardiolipin synthase-like enzyme
MEPVATARAAALRLAALVLLAGCAVPAPEPPRLFPDTGARIEASVYLAAEGPAQADATVRFAAVAGGETRISFVSVDDRPLAARLSCAGEARLLAAGEIGPGLYLRPGASRAVRVPGRGADAMPRLVVPPETARCQIDWGTGHSLTLLRDGAPEAAPAPQPGCTPPATAPGDALARAFFAERPLMQTCAAPTGPVELVPGELEGLKWRLDRLTGADVSATALTAGDPDMALDFSRAPRFDEIVVSYLLIRADLAGWLTTRALAFHAARGTRVRILASSALMNDFDRRPFDILAARYPNVEAQYFQWPARGPSEMLNSIQRANHVKLFLGLSPEPGRSFALIGGRNLTDGFYLDGKADYPDHPFLHSYGKEAGGIQGLAFHSVYDDFEVALTDRDRVAEIAAQFGRFYTRDAETQLMRGPATPGRSASGNDGLVRHFISLPWADSHAHEQLYVDLFDAAQSEIFAVSPFNYPTPAIEAALARAAARGVDVRFVTRRGADEPPAAFTRALNAEFDDENRGAYRFRLYDTGERLLHAKIIVIDDRLGIVASSNLNRRSYFHDTENGLVFLDRAVVRGLKAEAERYWAMSDAQDDPHAYALLLKLFEVMPWLEQYF